MPGGKKIPISPEIKAGFFARVRSGKESRSNLALEYRVGRGTAGGLLEREVKDAHTTIFTELV